MRVTAFMVTLVALVALLVPALASNASISTMNDFLNARINRDFLKCERLASKSLKRSIADSYGVSISDYLSSSEVAYRSSIIASSTSNESIAVYRITSEVEGDGYAAIIDEEFTIVQHSEGWIVDQWHVISHRKLLDR